MIKGPKIVGPNSFLQYYCSGYVPAVYRTILPGRTRFNSIIIDYYSIIL